MQVKIISKSTFDEMEVEINNFLSTLPQNPTNIKYDLENCITIIEYDCVRAGAICCECKFWDDNGDNLIGLCQRCGGRKRFSDKACNKYEDVRG